MTIKAQSAYTDNYIPPSPHALAFLKYGEYPVNHSTGVPDIKIPLHTIDFGDYQFPITASFHASGRSVAMNFSSLGLNWNLNAYGMITREIMGWSDLSLVYTNENIEQAESFYMPAAPVGSATRKDSYEKKLRLAGEHPSGGPRWDGQYDIYTLSLPGVSAKFIVRQNGAILFLSHIPYKITRTTTQFTVTDDKGVEYVFGTGTIPGYAGTYGFTETFSGMDGASAWMLQKITTPRGRQLRFKYNSVSTNPSSSTHGNYTHYDRLTIGDDLYSFRTHTVSNPSQYTLIMTPTPSNGLSHREYAMAYITAIESDSEEILFTYATPYLFLTDIAINAHSAVVKRVSFIPDTYFTVSSPLTLPNNNSRTIGQIHFKDGVNNIVEQYSFDYYNSPEKYNSVQEYNRGKDYWGYANANRSTASIIPVGDIMRIGATSNSSYTVGSLTRRLPDFLQKQMGMLRKIHYPTGGSSEFIYQENKYNDVGTVKSGPGLRVWKIINSDGVGPSTTTEYKYGVGENGVGLLMWRPSVRDFETVQLVSSPSGMNQVSTDGGSVYDADRYRWRVYSSEPSPQLSAAYRQPIFYSEVSEYTYPSAAGIINSNGKTVYKYSQPSYQLPFKEITDPHAGYSFYFQGATIRESTLPQLQNKMVYKYDAGTSTYQPIREYRYQYQMFRSLEIPQMWVYRYHRVPDSNPWSGGLNDDEVFVATLETSGGNVPIPWEIHSVLEHKIHSGANALVSETALVYEPGSNTLQTITEHLYDTLNHMLPIRTTITQSDGSKEVVQRNFPSHYTNTSGFINDMKQNHLISYPIEEVNYKEVGSTRTILSGKITTFKTGGQALVDEVYSLETLNPIALSSFKFSNRGVGILPPSGSATTYSPSGQYSPRVSFLSYDAYKNPIGVSEAGASDHSLIWDYSGRYLVARISNAQHSDVAYAGFESESKGNWTYSGVTVADATSPTGRRAYNLGGGNLQKTGLVTTRRYLLTYWAKSPSAGSISGGVATAVRVRNGWTQYRRVISGVASVALNGSVRIDDVRLHPAEAQMNTYTYDPLVGMTSHTDGSGYTRYYEYDTLGRLKAVRNLEGHLVEDYEYNYRD